MLKKVSDLTILLISVFVSGLRRFLFVLDYPLKKILVMLIQLSTLYTKNVIEKIKHIAGECFR